MQAAINKLMVGTTLVTAAYSGTIKSTTASALPPNPTRLSSPVAPTLPPAWDNSSHRQLSLNASDTSLAVYDVLQTVDDITENLRTVTNTSVSEFYMAGQDWNSTLFEFKAQPNVDTTAVKATISDAASSQSTDLQRTGSKVLLVAEQSVVSSITDIQDQIRSEQIEAYNNLTSVLVMLYTKCNATTCTSDVIDLMSFIETKRIVINNIFTEYADLAGPQGDAIKVVNATYQNTTGTVNSNAETKLALLADDIGGEISFNQATVDTEKEALDPSYFNEDLQEIGTILNDAPDTIFNAENARNLTAWRSTKSLNGAVVAVNQAQTSNDIMSGKLKKAESALEADKIPIIDLVLTPTGGNIIYWGGLGLAAIAVADAFLQGRPYFLDVMAANGYREHKYAATSKRKVWDNLDNPALLDFGKLKSKKWYLRWVDSISTTGRKASKAQNLLEAAQEITLGQAVDMAKLTQR